MNSAAGKLLWVSFVPFLGSFRSGSETHLGSHKSVEVVMTSFLKHYPMQLPTFCDEMSNISRMNIWSWLKSLLGKELTQLPKSRQTPFTFHGLSISGSLHQDIFVRQNPTVKVNWVVSSWHQPIITTLATVVTIHITRVCVLLGRLWVWIDIYQCPVPYWNMPLYIVLTTTIVYRPDMCRHVLSHNK